MNLSIAIISFNEEKNIGRTIEAVLSIAGEIIVVDSFSTDKTKEIATALGAKVYSEEWKGHIAQKNSALQKCKGEWILALDCDEIVSPGLASEIKTVIETGDCNGYRINRKTFYQGKLLKYAWQPDFKLRLIKNGMNGRWTGYDPHDVLMVDGKTGILKESIIHYSYTDFKDHMQRTVRYAEITAHSYARKGKTATAFKIIVRPLASFINKLFLKKAILDGTAGIIAALSSAYYTYMKYSFLWEIQHKKGEEHES